MNRAGIKAGEAIFAIDKQSVSKLTEKAFDEMLNARTGERIFTIGNAKSETPKAKNAVTCAFCPSRCEKHN